jgi:hypothetical protein
MAASAAATAKAKNEYLATEAWWLAPARSHDLQQRQSSGFQRAAEHGCEGQESHAGEVSGDGFVAQVTRKATARRCLPSVITSPAGDRGCLLMVASYRLGGPRRKPVVPMSRPGASPRSGRIPPRTPKGLPHSLARGTEGPVAASLAAGPENGSRCPCWAGRAFGALRRREP